MQTAIIFISLIFITIYSAPAMSAELLIDTGLRQCNQGAIAERLKSTGKIPFEVAEDFGEMIPLLEKYLMEGKEIPLEWLLKVEILGRQHGFYYEIKTGILREADYVSTSIIPKEISPANLIQMYNNQIVLKKLLKKIRKLRNNDFKRPYEVEERLQGLVQRYQEAELFRDFMIYDSGYQLNIENYGFFVSKTYSKARKPDFLIENQWDVALKGPNPGDVPFSIPLHAAKKWWELYMELRNVDGQLSDVLQYDIQRGDSLPPSEKSELSKRIRELSLEVSKLSDKMKKYEDPYGFEISGFTRDGSVEFRKLKKK